VIRLSDLRYTLRLWRRHPAMVTVAGLSLGLGVGATTTMYGVVNRVANYQLGFAETDRLAVLWTGDAEKGIQQQPPNWNIVQAVLERGQSFESFGFFQSFGAPVTVTGNRYCVTLPAKGLVPTLIEWDVSHHPAESLPKSNVSIAGMAASHPEPALIRAALASLGPDLDLPVTYDRDARLAAMLRTPRGIVTL